MSYIVYIKNKSTGTKYAYRSTSYRDPITKKPRSKRTYLGKVDPSTGEIIPKKERGSRSAPLSSEGETDELMSLRQELIQAREELMLCHARIHNLEEELNRVRCAVVDTLVDVRSIAQTLELALCEESNNDDQSHEED